MWRLQNHFFSVWHLFLSSLFFHFLSSLFLVFLSSPPLSLSPPSLLSRALSFFFSSLFLPFLSSLVQRFPKLKKQVGEGFLKRLSPPCLITWQKVCFVIEETSSVIWTRHGTQMNNGPLVKQSSSLCGTKGSRWVAIFGHLTVLEDRHPAWNLLLHKQN